MMYSGSQLPTPQRRARIPTPYERPARAQRVKTAMFVFFLPVAVRFVPVTPLPFLLEINLQVAMSAQMTQTAFV